MQIGTADAEAGELSRGWLEVTSLPTGTPETLPVIIANGEEPGPEMWVTGTIHGDEVTGIAVAQDLMHQDLPQLLHGCVVCLPTLNPAGLRRNRRTSYYHGDDPNRYFPDPDVSPEDRTRPPNLQEVIDERIYETFSGEADVLLDLHTAQVGSIPFVIRDRVLFGYRRTEAEAEALATEVGALASSIGLPVVREYEVEEYTDQDLQRSTAGAALNNAGIPALTLELGSHDVVDEAMRSAGVVGCYRAMVEVGLLDSIPDFAPTAAPYQPPVAYSVRRAVHPHTETAGIVRHRVTPGDVLSAGDPVADIVTPTGEHTTTVETEHDGYVLGRYEGVAAYENDPVTSLAVRDDGDLVGHRDAG